MTMSRAWAVKQFTFDGVTYDESNGAPLDISWDDGINEVPDRVADQKYPSAILAPEMDITVSITMRDYYTALTKLTKSNLVVTVVVDSDGSTEALTFPTMVFLGQRGGLTKSTPAQSTLNFRYEGSTGTVSRS